MEETAYAKINVALHVRAREPDGYHRIETLFAFAEDGDRLGAEPADQLSLRSEGAFASNLGDPADNLVLRAAEALRSHYAVKDGAGLVLDKRLPVASGIGGGSADAAATLRLLRRLWRLDASDEELIGIAATLGADVPACVQSRAVRGEGRGDRLAPVSQAWAGTPVLLVNPGVAMPTGPVFRAWNGIDRGPLEHVRDGRNDLEAAACLIAPEIGGVLERLRAMDGAQLVRMSGSGATCFALFDTERSRDAASDRLAAETSGWWQLATRLR